jgi:sulfate transport system substrate-binding protein
MRRLPVALLCLSLSAPALPRELQLLNVSYDPTRELYQEVNAAFAKAWAARTGGAVAVHQSHGGSGKQARAVLDGLEADVVTLALAHDIDALADRGGLLPRDWQKRLKHRSAPFTSTIVLLVRKGNPKGIRDWGDLVAPGVKVVTPNPKTSGGARWNYLAAWGWARRAKGGTEETARAFVTELFRHVEVLDSGARGAATTFVERRIGDALIAWESEALLVLAGRGGAAFELVTPSASILAETPVAVVDTYAKAHGTFDVARAYLDFLYTDEGQALGAKHYYRPRSAAAAAKFPGRFPALEVFTVDDAFGGWAAAHAVHFADGGEFDRLSRSGGP